MNKKMNSPQKYVKLLRIRTTLKKLQQISWNVSKLENKYNIDATSDEELDALLLAYSEYIKGIYNIYDELKDEFPIERQKE